MAEEVRAVGEHVVSWGVRSGRYSADRMAYWSEAYMADPAGTTRMIESLTPILADPGFQRLVAAAGRLEARDRVAGDSVDAEFAHLFPPRTDAEPVAAAGLASFSDAELRASGIYPPTWEEIDAAQKAGDARIALLSDEELETELFGPEH